MTQFCVMVRGPCRGKACDYWARIKIRKAQIETLALEIRAHIIECTQKDSMKLEDAVREYWSQLGIRSFDRLCDEEPDLCTKMIDAEVLAQT